MPHTVWADRKRAAFREFVAKRGVSISAWAKNAGIGSSAIYNFLNGRSESLSQRTLEALAEAAGVDIGEITGTQPRIVYSRLPGIPVMGEAWAAHYNTHWQRTVPTFHIHVPLPETLSEQAFAIQVRGTNEQRPYPDGSIVVCIDAANSKSSAYAPGQIVLVGHFISDTATDGLLVESTFREVVASVAGKAETVSVRATGAGGTSGTVLELPVPGTAAGAFPPEPGCHRLLARAVTAVIPQPGLPSLI